MPACPGSSSLVPANSQYLPGVRISPTHLDDKLELALCDLCRRAHTTQMVGNRLCEQSCGLLTRHVVRMVALVVVGIPFQALACCPPLHLLSREAALSQALLVSACQHWSVPAISWVIGGLSLIIIACIGHNSCLRQVLSGHALLAFGTLPLRLLLFKGRSIINTAAQGHHALNKAIGCYCSPCDAGSKPLVHASGCHKNCCSSVRQHKSQVSRLKAPTVLCVQKDTWAVTSWDAPVACIEPPRSVPVLRPCPSAQPTKLVAALTTGHVHAALILFDWPLALGARLGVGYDPC